MEVSFLCSLFVSKLVRGSRNSLCATGLYRRAVSAIGLVLGNVWKTSIFFNIDVFKENIDIYWCFRCFFFSFFQNISYVKNVFENQFPQVKRNKNSYRFLHFLKNIKNTFKNQFPWIKLNNNSYRFLHFLKNKICYIL